MKKPSHLGPGPEAERASSSYSLTPRVAPGRSPEDELDGDYEVEVTYSGNSSQYGPTNFIMSVEAVGGAQPVDGSQ
ncbi:hypothetical protein [Nonomuraea ceibae]|uniref:hypothetical protein n=1 Tax=Nonomuraea ceibae TaxID=1935170 RepID=UPI001C5ED44F|nr:hypothetical protein [Nonomuraea ceibae]